jgi:hypothetical protein
MGCSQSDMKKSPAERYRELKEEYLASETLLVNPNDVNSNKKLKLPKKNYSDVESLHNHIGTLLGIEKNSVCQLNNLFCTDTWKINYLSGSFNPDFSFFEDLPDINNHKKMDDSVVSFIILKKTVSLSDEIDQMKFVLISYIRLVMETQSDRAFMLGMFFTPGYLCLFKLIRTTKFFFLKCARFIILLI